LEEGEAETVRETISSFFKLRFTQKKVRKKPNAVVLVIDWQAKDLRRARLKEVFLNPDVSQLYPAAFSDASLRG
jgi:hypothetical protein